MSKKVLIGMSGGVDSSVAAYILKEQGYKVVGVTLIMWNNKIHGGKPIYEASGANKAIDDAKEVAKKLNIEHIVIDCSEKFTEHVVDYFVNEYKNGRTPNPCIECNKYIKFGFLLDYAMENGFDYIATGHYARVDYSDKDKCYCLKKSLFDSKDQTYVLYGLTDNQLKKVLMPLWEYSKDEIRKIAKEKIGLDISEKADSMEICFIPDNDYVSFIKKYDNYKEKEGNFVDEDGNVLGRHKGIINYTVGQRKGLGITFNKPMFVKEIIPHTNEVVLVEKGKEYSIELIADNINFVKKPNDGDVVKCKTRYSAKLSEGKIYFLDDFTFKIEFFEMQRAITPGQSAVIYENDCVVGGGIIKSTR